MVSGILVDIDLFGDIFHSFFKVGEVINVLPPIVTIFQLVHKHGSMPNLKEPSMFLQIQGHVYIHL